MSRRRRLSAEEERLWKRVADTATPIRKTVSPTPIAQKPKPDPIPEPFQPPAFRIGEKAGKTATRIPDTVDPPLRMDRKTFTRMKRGKQAPDARIDLHGMTAAAAHMALTGFLLRAHGEGKRLVLVITGKGRPNDHGSLGVLRREVPHWLERPPLRQIVLQVTEANRRHGGSGALYVYLSRTR